MELKNLLEAGPFELLSVLVAIRVRIEKGRKKTGWKPVLRGDRIGEPGCN